jgi:hypothetical protein
MAMRADHLEDWPDDLQAIFAAVGELMGTRRLNPEICATLAEVGDRIVPGHRVRLTHQSKQELG